MPKKASTADIWALGITTAIGGQYFFWNSGLSCGFGSYLFAFLLVGCAYWTMCFSICETASALPFAGGAYGLARCTLGYYFGFLVGCCETFQYVIYVSAAVLFLGSTLQPPSSQLQPLIWLLFYIPPLITHIWGGHLFWRVNFVIAILSLSLILLYCFGVVSHLNFWKYTIGDGTGASHAAEDWFVGGFLNFWKQMPSASSFFLGIQCVSLASESTVNPKRTIPRGLVMGLVTLTSSAICILLCACSAYPGTMHLPHETAPLSNGFRLLFHCSMEVASLLSIPATYSTVFGFMFISSRVVLSMAESHLLPKLLMSKFREDTPAAALLFNTCLSYLICTLMYSFPVLKQVLSDVCLLMGFVAYCSQCFGFLQLQSKFKNLPRDFISPFGRFGAIFAMLVWTLGLLSLVVLQLNSLLTVLIFAGFIFAFSMYYYSYAKKQQIFSEQEQKILFVAHVINFNTFKMKNGRSKRSRRDGVVASSSQSVKLRDHLGRAQKLKVAPVELEDEPNDVNMILHQDPFADGSRFVRIVCQAQFSNRWFHSRHSSAWNEDLSESSRSDSFVNQPSAHSNQIQDFKTFAASEIVSKRRVGSSVSFESWNGVDSPSIV